MGKRKVARKNKRLQLKWQLSKWCMRDGLWHKIFPHHVSEIVSCALLLWLSHCSQDRLYRSLSSTLKIQPTCWMALLAFSVHWALIPDFIHHWQAALAPESHIVSYLIMRGYCDKFSIDVQNSGNMGLVWWYTQVLVYFWLLLQSRKVNNAWYCRLVTSLCYLHVQW